MNLSTISVALKQIHQALPSLPENMIHSVCVSFMTCFVGAAILSRNLSMGIACAATAATASLVHSLTTPIYKEVTKHNLDSSQMTWDQAALRIFISCSAGAFSAALFNRKIDLLTYVTRSLFVSALHNHFKAIPVNKGQVYYC